MISSKVSKTRLESQFARKYCQMVFHRIELDRAATAGPQERVSRRSCPAGHRRVWSGSARLIFSSHQMSRLFECFLRRGSINWLRPLRSLQDPSCLFLQRPVPSFPFAVTWGRKGHPPHETFKSRNTFFGVKEAAKNRCMFAGVNETHLAVLAHADAGLRTLDPSASDALPGKEFGCQLHSYPPRALRSAQAFPPPLDLRTRGLDPIAINGRQSRRRSVTALLWRAAWPDLIVGLGIAALNLDAARELWEAACEEHSEAGSP